MNKVLLVFVCLLSFVSINGQVSNFCLNDGISEITLSSIGHITSGDFNGDGNVDLASANTSSNTISVFIGTGFGNFLLPVNYSVGFSPKSIKNADFNGDGILDLVFLTGLNVDVAIAYGTSFGTFLAPIQFTVNPNTLIFEVGDFNNDGKPDIIASNSVNTKIKVLLNNGIGGFLPGVDYVLNYAAIDIDIADYNNDGNKDIAYINNSSSYYASIAYGSPSGIFSFASPYIFGIFTSQAKSLISSDFDNDGLVDIAMLGENGSAPFFNISVFKRNGLGNFMPISTYTTNIYSNPISYIYSGDFNGDSNIDIVGMGPEYSNVLLGNGTGSLTLNSKFYYGSLGSRTETKDFNNDGIVDLAIANNGYASLILGTSLGIFKTNKFASGEAGGSAYINSIASADFNNDGLQDLVATNSGHSSVSISKGLGFGQVSSPPINFPVGLYPQCVVTGDFNGDLNIDMAVSNLSSYNVSILLGTGTGSFLPTVNYPVGIYPRSMTVNDFNSDGNLDLAVINSNDNNLLILSGSPTGTFATTGGYSTNNLPWSVTSDDFNGDGKPDIVVAHYNASNILIYINSGSGSFLPAITYSVGNVSKCVMTGDFNGDANKDIAVANIGTDNITVLLGTGIGTFSSSINYSVGNDPFSIVKDDYNQDGKSDLLIAHTNSTFFSILMSTPSGSFSPAFNYQIGENQNALSSADLNGDGKKDIIIENRIFISSSPTITINSLSSICLGNSAILLVNGLGISSYTWSTGATTSSITVTPLINTTYTLIGSTANGCMNTAIKTISVSIISPTISVNSGLLCSGNSFTMNPTGASTYTYSSGSAIVSPTVNSTYNVVGTSSLGCVSSNTAVSSVTISAAPILSFVGTNSVCIGSSTSFTANGASTYSWSTGAPTPSVSVSPTITTTYSVVGTNTLGCTKTETISVIVNNTCQDVWPGDVNSDGMANNIDVLELGLHIGQTGPNRATTSNLWQSYFSNNWVGTLSGGKNVNHSDCNGDGTINQSDTLAIFNNYGLTHAFKPSGPTVVDPQLNIISDQSFVEKGKWGTASVYLGDAVNPINNVNGVAYTLNYDNSLIETDSVYLDYPISFINVGNQNIHFHKRNFASSVLYTATTHTTNTNVSGNGKIATVHFKIKSSLTVDAPLNFSISQAKSSNASGTIVPLTVGGASVLAVGASVGLSTYDNFSTVTIFPNPTNSVLNIEVNLFNENMNVKVYNALGQIVLTEVFTSKSLQLNTSALTNGIYFINVMSNNKTLTRSKFVKE